MILDKLTAASRRRVERAKSEMSVAELIKRLDATETKKSGFKDAILNREGVSIIAEIKKASPSKGLIRPDFDHMTIAEQYAECDIQCMSILTEPEYFKGNLSFVSDVKSKFDIPVLRKDFTVDEYQIYEAKLYGADAVLLIMAALDDAEFKQFYDAAKSLEMDVLVETHNEIEVKRAAEYADIIGVNNRNLQTFEEDLTTCERLLEFIPGDRVKVAESAIRTHNDFMYLESLKFDAALIGEAFMRQGDVKAAVDKMRYGE